MEVDGLSCAGRSSSEDTEKSYGRCCDDEYTKILLLVFILENHNCYWKQKYLGNGIARKGHKRGCTSCLANHCTQA